MKIEDMLKWYKEGKITKTELENLFTKQAYKIDPQQFVGQVPDDILSRIREKAKSPERLRVFRIQMVLSTPEYEEKNKKKENDLTEQTYQGLLRWQSYFKEIDRG